MIGGALFGPICDRFGYKPVMIISCLLMFLSLNCVEQVIFQKLNMCYMSVFGLGAGLMIGAANGLVADVSMADKRSNLSFLNLFFVFGILLTFIAFRHIPANAFDYDDAVIVVSFLNIAVIFSIFSVRFPIAKRASGKVPLNILSLLKDDVLLLIALFMFFQFCFEGLINNWIIHSMMAELSMPVNYGELGMSLHVIGIVIMRVLIGTYLKRTKSRYLFYSSLLLFICGCTFLKIETSFIFPGLGLMFMGAGLAVGFPVMFGFVGARYTELSATAFGIVLCIAMVGTVAVNYIMATLLTFYSTQYLMVIIYLTIVLMAILATRILYRVRL